MVKPATMAAEFRRNLRLLFEEEKFILSQID
jgi:hypothetical protein